MELHAPEAGPRILSENEAAGNLCPRCGQLLTDPAGLGWCQACGYCRSLEEDPAKDLLAEPGQPAAVTQAGQAIGRAPRWIWVWLAGLIVAAGLSYGVGQWLPKNSYPRALWTSLQVAIGLLTIFLAQFFALVRLAPSDGALSFKDALLPGRLWSQAFKRISSFTVHLCIASWALTLVVCAFLFIGGLSHWFTYLPSNQKNADNIQR